MLSSVVKFGQILPIGSTHFGFFFADFHWDMSGNLINIYNLHYNTVYSSEKKNSLKLLQIALSGPYLGKNYASWGHAQNQVQIFFFWR